MPPDKKEAEQRMQHVPSPKQKRQSAAIGLFMALITALVFASMGMTAARASSLLLHGGPIHTADDAQPMVEAVLVDQGVIIHAGSLADAKALATDETKIIDLAGAALFPGFVDAHAHMHGIGLRELTLNLEGTTSISDLQKRLKAHLKSLPADDRSLVIGRGWIETHWPEGRFPNRGDLDAVSTDRPIVLVRADGHAAVANSMALEGAGIDAETKPPFGGDILKNEAGVPNGMLIDTAMGLVVDEESADGDRDLAQVFLAADAVYRSYGWSGMHNMSVVPDHVPVLQRLSDEGAIGIRVYNSIERSGAEALMVQGPLQSANGLIRTRAVKLYMDGALGSRGAALLEPYADADGTGLLMMKEAETLAFLKQALVAGIQVNTHAIGDRANRLVLDWYEQTFAAVPPGNRALAKPRWRIEHAQVISPADLGRFSAQGIIASMQPSHAIGDLHFAPDRLGMERLAGAYAWRDLLADGTIIAAGSDAPVERGDPMIEFYAAVARMDLSGYSAEGWHSEQAVDRQTALKMLTLWPAFAAFQEDELGSITKGKRADFSVFSRDIMSIDLADIPKTKAVMTIVDGQIIWRDAGFAGADGGL